MDYFKTFGIELGKDNFDEKSVYSIILIYNILNNEISSYLKPFKLSPAKFNVLMAIKHQGGKEGISQVEISKHLIVTPSNMTRLLDKLQKEKLITRGSQAEDRRVNIIKVTEKASKLLVKIWPGYLKTIKKLADELDHGDQKAVSALLMKWLGKLIS